MERIESNIGRKSVNCGSRAKQDVHLAAKVKSGKLDLLHRLNWKSGTRPIVYKVLHTLLREYRKIQAPTSNQKRRADRFKFEPQMVNRSDWSSAETFRRLFLPVKKTTGDLRKKSTAIEKFELDKQQANQWASRIPLEN